ncbi:zygote arrest protein 1-like [Pecten maximus]|uniref:zygote arrest protein 1-like n=1 Tax=Pecten maximus TaxID=6579 RepID=UPI001458D944|nr:zygote arrest protein 1-like [Pecten maximus]
MFRGRRQRGRGRRPRLERKYGFFGCSSCKGHWESAQVYCVEGTKKVYFKQECKRCNMACNPYRVEDIECPRCGLPVADCKENGGCYDEDDVDEEEEEEDDDDYDERHVDAKKPHRADLCLKCRSGWKCT